MKILSFLGKSGSGKGTQAERLAQRYGMKVISSGDLLRKRSEQDDFVGRRVKGIIERGGLAPTPIIFHLWLHELERIRDEGGAGIIFEGSPRKIHEAEMLDDVLDFYELGKDFKALHLHISDEEAMRRLLDRGRHDDDQEAIQIRLNWFNKEVMPVIEHYKAKESLITINGEQSRDDLEKEILLNMADFFAA